MVYLGTTVFSTQALSIYWSKQKYKNGNKAWLLDLNIQTIIKTKGLNGGGGDLNEMLIIKTKRNWFAYQEKLKENWWFMIEAVLPILPS